MKRLLFLDKDSNEIENLLLGKKNKVIRGANIKKYPYKMIGKGDIVYLRNNNNEGILLASAIVLEAEFIEESDLLKRTQLIKSLKPELLLSKKKIDYVLKRKYISIFTLTDIKEEYATYDNSLYGKVDDWMIINPLEKEK